MNAPGWTHGPDEEGPFSEAFATREEAVAAGTEDAEGGPFWVARTVAIELPRPGLAGDMIERADEAVNDDSGFCFDESVFEATTGQMADLDRRLSDAFAAWCEEHKFTANGYLVDHFGVKDAERVEPVAAPAGGAR